jgi:polyisoprenoid-binding protein YceI
MCVNHDNGRDHALHLDPAKSTLEFSFMHAGAPGKGHFKSFPTTLDFAPESPAEGHLEVVVDMGSFDTADKDRNDTLRGPDLFDVAKNPQAHFTPSRRARDGREERDTMRRDVSAIGTRYSAPGTP